VRVRVIEEVARKRARARVLESMKRCRDEAKRGGPMHHRTAANRNTRCLPSTDNKIEGRVTDMLHEGHDREMEIWDRRIAAYEKSGKFIFLAAEEKRKALTSTQVE
jgi:hypothetical protein